jgi:hypothetical protein
MLGCEVREKGGVLHANRAARRWGAAGGGRGGTCCQSTMRLNWCAWLRSVAARAACRAPPPPPGSRPECAARLTPWGRPDI